ncbi:MAG TPA: hypothetical protein VD905_07760, partial [Flavobacteriales bacterium]|nr:hypothetical protein [Flavobacteriales bacterium]
QQLIILLACIGIAVVLVFLVFVSRSLKLTRRQKNIIEEQTREVQLQTLIVEEKQKEIMDSIYYAKRIQQALLPTKRYIERSINLKKNNV